MRRALPELALIATVYASLALANNTHRLLAYALPALLPLALAQLRACLEAKRAAFVAVAALALWVQLLVYVRTAIEATAIQPFDPVSAGAVALFWAGCAALRLSRTR